MIVTTMRSNMAIILKTVASLFQVQIIITVDGEEKSGWSFGIRWCKWWLFNINKKNSEMISFTFFAIFVSLFLRFPQCLAINGGEIQLIFVQHGFNGHWLGNRCVLLDQLPIGLFAKLLNLPGGGWFEKWPWRHCLVPLQVGGHQGQAKQNTADGRGIGNPVKWEKCLEQGGRWREN